MSLQPGRSTEEIYALVMAYERLPHGTKLRWLEERGIPAYQMGRWVRAVFDGDLSRGLVPRKGTPLTMGSQRRRIAKAAIDPYEEIKRLKKRNQELEAANDALGKAIGLLHEKSAQEPVEQTPNDEPGSETSSIS